MEKKFNFSDGLNNGFFSDIKAFKASRKTLGPINPGKRIVDSEVEIPFGWAKDSLDESAIVKIPTMKNLVKALSLIK